MRAFSTSGLVPPRRCGLSPVSLRSLLHFSPSSSSSLRGSRHYSGGFHYGGQSGESIFALGTSPAGKSGVAVVRISGERAGAAVRQLTRAQELPPPRLASLRKLYHRDELLDEGLVLWFPGPRSFTGEDMAELHIHGSHAAITAVLNALGKLPGMRSAEPGEFTKRAFQNGKMDLTEAEGLADLIDAETEAQRKQALRQMGGALGRLCNEWREELIKCIAHVEAVIDFGEDEHIDHEVAAAVQPRIKRLHDMIALHLSDSHRGERMRSGASLAIVGPPNAGKSSLLNLLARRKAAIVSSIPGTTRDVIEVSLDLAGYPLTIADTAGIRHSEDEIEKEGVALARERFASSDIKICLFDGTTYPSLEPDLLSLVDTSTLVVLNKKDLLTSAPASVRLADGTQRRVITISCKNYEGLEDLTKALESQVKSFFESGAAPDGAVVTRARHREHLERSLQHLRTYLDMAEEASASREARMSIDMAAEELRRGLAELGRITGRVDLDEILDVIFSDFCIGK